MKKVNYESNKEAIEIIKGCFSEHDLSETGLSYAIEHVSDEVNVSGYIIVRTQEGGLFVPYGNVEVGLGYEQLTTDEIREASTEELISVLSDRMRKVELFKDLFEIEDDNSIKRYIQKGYRTISVVGNIVDVEAIILVSKDITNEMVEAELSRITKEMDEATPSRFYKMKVSDILNSLTFDYIELENIILSY